MNLSSELLATLQATQSVVDIASRTIASESLNKILLQTQLSSNPPKQTVQGLVDCDMELDAIRRLLFIRTLTQDHGFGVERIAEVCGSLLEKIKRENDPYQPDQLPRIDFNSIDPETFFQTYVYPQQPVIIENCKYATQVQTLDETLQQYADKAVPLMNVNTGEHYVGPLSDLGDKEVVLSRGDKLIAENPEILAGFDLNRFIPYIRLNRFSDQYFVSNCASGSTAHFDANTNLFFMLEGEKRWVLIDPNFFYLTYMIFLPMDGKTALSWMDEDDTERCPLFNYCPRYEFTLKPGEMLFSPNYYLHSVRNETKKTVALGTRWFGEPGVHFQDPCPLYTKATYLSPRCLEVLFNIRRMFERTALTGERSDSLYEPISQTMKYDTTLNYSHCWGLQPPTHNARTYKG